MMALKKIVITVFCFFVYPVFFSVFIWGQLQVKIGNDTTFCADNIGQGLQIASQLCVTGGVPPYTYCWSMPEPFETVPNRWWYASNVLSDTTLANPTFTSNEINKPQMWTQFNLTVCRFRA